MTRKHNAGSRPVYSTDKGNVCPIALRQRWIAGAREKAAAKPSGGDGVVRVGRETKRRKGKGVSLITGIALQGRALTQLAKRLKAKCGSGGTVKNGVVEIQGDYRDLLVQELNKEGFTVKRSGG